MLGPRHEIARMQGDFYRDQYRKVLRWIMGLMIVVYLLIAAIIYSIFVQPSQAYYGNTTDGKILPMPGMTSG